MNGKGYYEIKCKSCGKIILHREVEDAEYETWQLLGICEECGSWWEYFPHYGEMLNRDV